MDANEEGNDEFSENFITEAMVRWLGINMHSYHGIDDIIYTPLTRPRLNLTTKFKVQQFVTHLNDKRYTDSFADSFHQIIYHELTRVIRIANILCKARGKTILTHNDVVEALKCLSIRMI